jgi:hypothetical protein
MPKGNIKRMKTNYTQIYKTTVNIIKEVNLTLSYQERKKCEFKLKKATTRNSYVQVFLKQRQKSITNFDILACR